MGVRSEAITSGWPAQGPDPATSTLVEQCRTTRRLSRRMGDRISEPGVVCRTARSSSVHVLYRSRSGVVDTRVRADFSPLVDEPTRQTPGTSSAGIDLGARRRPLRPDLARLETKCL